MTLRVPFQFGIREMYDCAERYGVIVCPMSLFSAENFGKRMIRLSFSYLRGETIEEGVQRLVSFLEAKTCGK